MTKLLVVGDVHLAKSAPGRRTDTYCDDILRKLDHTITIAHEQGVDGVLWLGDVYHNPRADRVPHELTKAISVRARQYNVPVYVVPGNHDMRAGDLDSVYVSQPIALLDELPNVTLMRWEPVVAGDIVIHPVPGVPHIPVEDYAERVQQGDFDDKFHLVAVHQSIARDGADSMPFACVGADEVATALPWADLVAYGHLHDEYGWYEMNGVTFANFGSICRGTISESDLNKQPKVYVLTVDNGQADFELFDLPFRPSEEVFRIEEYLTEKSRKRDMEEYVAQIQRVSVQTFSLDTVIGNIHERDDVTDDVKNYSVDCINKVRG